MHARAVRDQLSFYWHLMLYPLVAVGFVLDVAFNLIFGSVMYLELPRELLFTTRCKRHYRASEGWRLSLAAWWKRTLDPFHQGHID